MEEQQTVGKGGERFSELESTVSVAQSEEERRKLAALLIMAFTIDQKILDALNRIISDDFGSLSPDFASLFEECFEAFEYKGFDPDRTRRVLAFRQSKLRDDTVIQVGPSKIIGIAGPKGLNNLISFLVALFNVRGNNLDAIKGGLEGNTKVTFDALVASLDLKSKVMIQGKPKSSETLTLSRISAAFPLHSLTVVRNLKFDRKIIDLSDIGVNDSDLGRCLQHPVCASTITNQMVEDGCQAITFLASLRLNAVIGVNQKNTPERLWLYHLAMLASKAVPEARKQIYWGKLYAPDVVREWIMQARKILKKDLPEALYDSVTQYRRV